MLFNPFCSADPVYFPDMKHTEEYVTHDEMHYWTGTHRAPVGKIWHAEPMAVSTLKCALLFLGRVQHPTERADPSRVTRHLTALVDAAMDGGLAIGSWQSSFAQDVAPERFTRSTQLFEEYLETGKPVKYVQCWIYAAVLVSMLRALGIPSRLISAFKVCHDATADGAIDRVSDLQGRPTAFSVNGEHGKVRSSADSIWTFHCFSEAWFRRDDLRNNNFLAPEVLSSAEQGKFDGWQLADGTPQELSGGDMRCGPCPVASIRMNMVVPYDGAFCRQMFHAMSRRHLILENGERILYKESLGNFGCDIRTSDGCHKIDLKAAYKVPEAMAKRVTYDATQWCHIQLNCLAPEGQKQPLLGTPFKSRVIITAREDFDADVAVGTSIVPYTKSQSREFNPVHKNLKLSAGQSHTINLNIPPEVYLQHFEDLNDSLEVRVILRKRMCPKKRIAVKAKCIGFDPPQLTVGVQPQGSSQFVDCSKIWNLPPGSTAKIRASFVNPFPFPLANVDFTLQGPMSVLRRPLASERAYPSIPAGKMCEQVFPIRLPQAQESTELHLVANLRSHTFPTIERVFTVKI
eukprot:NODE_503_length_2026_cov_12.111786_g398_i0.p1 GENE.NODE_503_length_2026_cov_12.111786_g398_i0~~NODE_503_length_2026_cov_12.111786_g398_i0.p1  ORF type:complete len:657 (-),score=142.85 NODE_503_length_2026_cov_12.111786_g398_i0:54-1775(-)